jgi:hypothetical protein
MPRAMRVEFPGAIYHVMDRGDRREDIFINDVDRQDFLKALAEACQKTAWQVQEELMRRGWCLGSEQFRQEMLERMDGRLGENHSGELHRETAEQKANRILSEELSRRGWTESDLAARRRSDPDKLAIAVRLRNETTLPVKWIAARVRRGCKLARPKGLNPCSIARAVDNTNTNLRGPTNHAHS